jgi:hypothetical protein
MQLCERESTGRLFPTNRFQILRQLRSNPENQHLRRHWLTALVYEKAKYIEHKFLRPCVLRPLALPQ